MKADMSRIEDRIESLTRRVAFFQHTLVIATLGFVVLLICGAAGKPAAIVEAQGYHLVDDVGNLRGVFGLDAAGRPYLSLLGLDGSERCNIVVGEQNKPQLVFLNDKGKASVHLYISPENNPSLNFLDPDKGTERMRLFLDNASNPFMGFVDRDGNPRLSMSVGEEKEGTSGIKVVGDSGGSIGLFGARQPGLVIRDPADNQKLLINLNETNDPAVTVFEGGKSRKVLP